jgi:arylsulfatase A-like enzyme
MREQKPNVVFIMTDTLRLDYIGCYGNTEVKTPNIDRLAKDSILFTNAHPESLPTIPVRRAVHTGRRAYPFNDYNPLKWDFVYVEGWQPMSNEEDTLAENLSEEGYYTGFVTDTLPYFAPGMNFTRGFWQWEYIRGKAQDKWKSPAIVTQEMLAKYNCKIADALKHFPSDLYLRLAANTAHIMNEEATTTARTFQWAMDFVEDNRKTTPFYMMIDCFDPHEPWDAPNAYYELYADPNFKGKTMPYGPYGKPDSNFSPEQLHDIRANYMAQITLLDTWAGHFIDKLKRLNLYEDTLIVFTSDHGTNFLDNSDGIMGKPEYSMFPGVMNIPLLLHLPHGMNAGMTYDGLVYNVDITATIYDICNLKQNASLDGISLLRQIDEKDQKKREYLTCRYGHHLWYCDENYWVIMDLDFNLKNLYDVKKDKFCTYNLVNASTISPRIVDLVKSKLLEDAKGQITSYHNPAQTDAIGRLISMVFK